MWPRIGGLRALALGTPGELRTRLNTLVLSGAKTATAGLVQESDDETEDLLWQQTVIRLQGNTLGRSADGDNAMVFDGFDEIDEGNYLVRQTLFRTRFLITAANTPQPPPP